MLGTLGAVFGPLKAVAEETAMPANIMVEAISSPNVLGISISKLMILHDDVSRGI